MNTRKVRVATHAGWELSNACTRTCPAAPVPSQFLWATPCCSGCRRSRACPTPRWRRCWVRNSQAAWPPALSDSPEVSEAGAGRCCRQPAPAAPPPSLCAEAARKLVPMFGFQTAKEAEASGYWYHGHCTPTACSWPSHLAAAPPTTLSSRPRCPGAGAAAGHRGQDLNGLLRPGRAAGRRHRDQGGACGGLLGDCAERLAGQRLVVSEWEGAARCLFGF